MDRKIAITVLAGLLAIVCLGTSVRADTAGGTVTGTVTKDGAPVVNAKVLVFKAGDRKGKGDKGAGATTTGTADGAGKTRPQPLMTSTTDGNGKFTLTLPAGQYVIIAGEKGEGRGHQKVTVTDGQATSVTIAITPRPARTKPGAAAN